MENMGNILKILVGVMFLISSCKAPLYEIKSTQQRWCVEDKGIYGINYHFIFKTRKDYRSLSLDSVWLHNQWIKNFHYSVLGKSNTDIQFKPEDTVIISINMSDTLCGTKAALRYTICQKSRELMFYKWIFLKNLCR